MKTLLLLLVTGTALAQPSADQKKIDAAKTGACEKSKKFMADQKAKGKCAAEADEAAKITCSAATAKQVNDLFQKCVSAKPADKPVDKPAEPAAAAAPAVPKCRALEGTAVLEEAEDKLAAKCSTALVEKLKKRWCTAENKGKKFDYVMAFDHVVGKKKVADKKSTWTCRTVAK